MPFDPDRHHRQSLRLRTYDYSSPGAYFLTICTREREQILGEVVDGEMDVNETGQRIDRTWHDLPSRFPNILLDHWVIMPNHIHGIIYIVGAPLGAPHQWRQSHNRNACGEGAASGAPTGAKFEDAMCRGDACLAPILGRVIRAFKSLSAVDVNRHLKRTGIPLWQRNYYERIIRNEKELNRIRQYIQDNPKNWDSDPENV